MVLSPSLCHHFLRPYQGRDLPVRYLKGARRPLVVPVIEIHILVLFLESDTESRYIIGSYRHRRLYSKSRQSSPENEGERRGGGCSGRNLVKNLDRALHAVIPMDVDLGTWTLMGLSPRPRQERQPLLL